MGTPFIRGESIRHLVRPTTGGRAAIAGLITVAFGALGGSAYGAPPHRACVDNHGPCFPTISAAVGAAHTGDVVRVGRGHFDGGIMIQESVRLIGAGADRTVIHGGGPVLTVRKTSKREGMRVSLARVTIRGGVSRGDGTVAEGGGVDVTYGPHFSTGANVTIRRSVIAGNVAKPTSTKPVGPPCPGRPCPYAEADGGGIANHGNMKVRNTVIRGNLAGGIASDAKGGGLYSAGGLLALTDSRVRGNRAVASKPNGRFAEGGGVLIEPGGELRVTHSVVRRNRSRLTSSLPYSFDGGKTIDMHANTGGILAADHVPTTIVDSRITDNTARANDPQGQPAAFDAGILVGASKLVMRGSLISRNRVFARVASTEGPGPSGTAIELDGGARIDDTQISRNSATVTSPGGVAGVAGALAVFTFDGSPARVVLRNSSIRANRAAAFSRTGAATVQGVGVLNNSLLVLQHVQVRDNTGRADGPDGFAQGGGIWNGVLLSGPPVRLTLDHTAVRNNSLTASSGLDTEGGGLFTTRPPTLVHSTIAGNLPDQCSGC